MKKSLFQKPIFWILHCSLFIAALLFSIRYYPMAFPMVDLTIKMDRTQALTSARALASKNQWGPTAYQQAAGFESDQQTQTFIELAGGGKKVLANLMNQKLYFPYTWVVRHFKESKINETRIAFTPDGEFNGFQQVLPETLPGAALPQNDALKVAETAATTSWGLSLADYQLVEKSSSTLPSKRVDHSFIYERKNLQIGEGDQQGKFRLALTVGGDRLIGIRNYIEVPAAFTRKYGEMRSANNTIAAMSSAAILVLYAFGGCFFGLFYLARKRWVVWKAPLIAASGVAFAMALERLNQFPLAWMGYDTAVPRTAMIVKTFLSAGLVFLSEFLILSLSFMAAESLSRLAFPKQPQLWKIWKPENASTLQILGRTLGGYLAVGIFFAYVVAIYLIGSKYFGWWSPSDVLFQPDALAAYLPWFTPIANSLHAGFWEESLFRAVPLSCAALLGNRFGHRKSWLALGFVVQALIFASAHANYPAQPSYARVLELIPVSILFGTIFINFGLLPGILLHFIFDTTAFAIPLFASSSPRIWIDQMMVVGVALIPLWIILWARIREGRWKQLSLHSLNTGWTPRERSSNEEQKHRERTQFRLTQGWVRAIQILGVVSLIAWFGLFRFESDTWNLNVGREDAIQTSKAEWKKQGVDLSAEWVAQASLSTGLTLADEFIWKTSGQSSFRSLIGSYLYPPIWVVRFVRFNTDVAEREEFYQVAIARDHQFIHTRHQFPEARPGASITDAEARTLTLNYIENHYPGLRNSLQEISSSDIKQPHRIDWQFVFRNPSVPLKEGEARISISISGNQITSYSPFIFIPEDWVRQERNEKTYIRIVTTVCFSILALIAFAALVVAVIRWTQKKFDTPLFWKTFGTLIGINGVIFCNDLQSSFAQFSTIEPRSHQILSLFGFGVIRIIATAAMPAILMGYLSFALRPSLERFAQAQGKPWSEIVTGLSLGIVLRAVFSGLDLLIPPESPRIPQFSALVGSLIYLECLTPLLYFFMIGLLLLIIYQGLERWTHDWTQRRKLGALGLFILSFVLCGTQAHSFSSWIAMGALSGVFLSFLFLTVFRDQPRLIPLTLGSVYILGQVKQLEMRAFPQVTGVAILTILLIGAATWIWYQWLNGNRKGPRHRPQVSSV